MRTSTSAVVRVLHERSFIDDPTRLLRALRYEARLGFRMDTDTERLARDAAAEGALRTVSGARVRDELMDLLAEPELPTGVARMRELGVDRALHTAIEADAELVASAALGAVALGADRALVALAALCAPAAQRLDLWLADLHLAAWERDAVARAARVAPRLAAELRAREHTALGAARPARPRDARRALARAGDGRALRADPALGDRAASRSGSRSAGADLLAAGVPEGPALGRALDETLSRKLDGLVRGRDQELETALLLARGASDE